MYTVRQATPEEYGPIGELLITVYSQLEGFPKKSEQPDYYQLLANVGEFIKKPEIDLLVAVDENDRIAGAVVYFGDMQHYGSGGTATQEKNASGFRLLAVVPDVRGNGIGKLLTMTCIAKAKKANQKNLVIHTTKAMQTAWKMYEKIGFRRAKDLDFMQHELPVFRFRLKLR